MTEPYVLPDYIITDYILDPNGEITYSTIRAVLHEARLAVVQSETRRTKLE